MDATGEDRFADPSGQIPQRNAQCAGRVRHAMVVTGELDALAPVPEKLA